MNNHQSEIEKLIQELCSGGVSSHKLDDVILSLKTGLNPRKNFRLNGQANLDHDSVEEVLALIRTEKLKLLAEIGEPKLEDAINEEKTPEGVKSTPKEPNDIFIILSPYFECKDCGELGCPYNPDVPAELAEAIDQYTQSKLKAFAGDIEKAIGEKEVSEYKQFDPNDEMILADQLIYDCRNDYRAELRESLKAIKERLIK